MSTAFSDMRLDLRLQGCSAAVAAILTVLSRQAFGQGASNWRVYKAADGLPESTCISVTVAPRGKVLVRHLDLALVSTLDGYGVTAMPGPDGNGRVYESPGGQYWTVVREGLQEFDEGRWTLHPVPEITAEFQAVIARPIDPVPLCPVRQGLVVFLLRDGLWEFNAEDPGHVETRMLCRAAKTHLGRFTGLTPARDGGLWVAGEHGLAKIPAPLSSKSESQLQEFVPPASLGITGVLEVREVQAGAVVVVAESVANRQKEILYFDGQDWKLEGAGPDKIRHAWRGSDRTWWATTADSLLQWEEGRAEVQENEEIWANHYYDLALESGGAFWLATSDGLFRYAPLAWRIPAPARRITSVVHCMGEDKEGRIWFATAAGLYSLQDTQIQEHVFPPGLERTLQGAHALFVLGNGAVLLETSGQLFQFDPPSGSYQLAKEDGAVGGEFKTLGALKDGSVCVLRTVSDSTERRCELQRYDGVSFEAFTNQFSEACNFGLKTLFTARNGDLWLGGERGVAWYHDQKWQTFSTTNQSAPVEAAGFLELADGTIWCAGRDRVWEFDGRDWFTLRSGFDRVNGILRTQDGSIWVASNNGVHRFFHGAWIENGPQEGLAGSGVRQVYEDQRGRIWAATTHGLNLYHPDADADPPRAFIGKPPDPENKFAEGKTITLTFGGRDKWQYTPAERLLFSYRLDERDWSAFSDGRSVTFEDLPPGKHYFQVRAMDRNGNITGQGPLDPKAAKIEFMIVLPWYKETRLILVSMAGLAAALFFAGLAFNRHRQLVRGYAVIEQKIEQRTRELEIANRELLHSQKMNALGTLAAGIAHDFNNILSIIKGSAQIIEDNLDNPRKVSARIDRIKTVVDQGADIVKAMLGFGRASDTQPNLCELNAVVDDTVKLLGDRFLREVKVSFLPGEALPSISAPRGFIQQILLNFIFNAAESMAARKQINLRTATLTRLPAILALAPGQAADYACVSVEDFGCGIPPENLPRIFEPFFTTKAFSARRGTGLGLSMAYELAKKIDAGLAVESVPGRGSTFTLILPVRPLAAPAEGEELAKMKAAV